MRGGKRPNSGVKPKFIHLTSKIIARYKELGNCRQVGNLFNISHMTVQRILSKNNIPRKSTGKKAPELLTILSLPIGKSTIVKTNIVRGLYSRLKKHGVRISCKRIGEFGPTTSVRRIK